MNTAMNMKDGGMSNLRPVKSVESLISTPSYGSHFMSGGNGYLENTLEVDESVLEVEEAPRSTSGPATPVSDTYNQFHSSAGAEEPLSTAHSENSKTHNR
jgi:hypothetical protein